LSYSVLHYSFQKDDIIPFHAWLNSIHPDIQWTYEVEKEGRLNMLDLTIICAPDGSLTFEVYRKPTHTGQYISHDGNAPQSSLLVTVRALTRRADSIPSTPQAKAAEHKRVRFEIATNGYTQDTYNRGRYCECNRTHGLNGTSSNTPYPHKGYAPGLHSQHPSGHIHTIRQAKTLRPHIHTILQGNFLTLAMHHEKVGHLDIFHHQRLP
jgi:hypothetical protein